MRSTFYARIGKRWFDLFLSLVGLCLLSPFLVVIAVVVRLTSPGPAIFRQARTGRFQKSFLILKFRTMRHAAAEADSLLTAAGDSRITRLGRWLRNTKIDELPQLFNVLTGEMSLVGPRPEVPLFTERYSEPQKRVFEERPGLTGPSIIFDEEELMAGQTEKEHFYVTTVLPAKLEIDLAYCTDIHFLSDLRYLRLTFTRLFHRSGRGPTTTGSIEHLAGVGDVNRP